MKTLRKALFCVVGAGVLFVFAGCGTIVPTVSRTDLYSDIHPHTLTIAAGTDIATNNTLNVLPDPLYAYISYAPTDWLELGLGGHWMGMLVGPEAKIDILDIFTNNLPASLLLVGGANFLLSGGSGNPVVVNAGLAFNWSFSQHVEAFIGVGGSSLGQIPVIDVGAWLSPFKWLAFTVDAKAVLANVKYPSVPSTIFFSISPSLTFHLGKK